MYEDIIHPTDSTEEKMPFIHGMLRPEGSEIVVTPKLIHKLVGRLSKRPEDVPEVKVRPAGLFEMPDDDDQKKLDLYNSQEAETFIPNPNLNIIELTDEIDPRITARKRNIRLMDVLGFLNHVIHCNPHDPISPNELVQELQACIDHIKHPSLPPMPEWLTGD
jgi:hypothetical protein